MTTKKNDELKISSEEEAVPTGIATPKEAEQQDEIRNLQVKLAQVVDTLNKVTKKTGIKSKIDERTGDSYGFLRCIDKDPITAWRMLPGSFVAIGAGGQELDEQFMEITCLSGTKHKMSYRDFDVRTANSQLQVKLHDYCQKNAMGEWRAKPRTHDDLVKVTLSTDGGTTFSGQEVDIPIYLLN